LKKNVGGVELDTNGEQEQAIAEHIQNILHPDQETVGAANVSNPNSLSLSLSLFLPFDPPSL
jgi:hypothetical protein